MSRRASPLLAQADVILGTAQAPYPYPQFRLTPPEQKYHGLLWGSTGSGKSKLLQSIFLQHLNKGNGVCLIDPHADLAIGCLEYLVGKGYFTAPDAFEKLVYIDFPADSHVPFNVLAQPYDPHTVALNTLEALTRTWGDLRSAPLFSTLFLASALTLIANRLPLTDIYPLLLDGGFREACLASVPDPLVHQTFAFYERHGRGQAGSTLRRAFLLSFSPVIRGTLGQTENWLDFRALMDAGRSVIINLGSIGDPITRRLLGCLIMVQIEQAALSRTNLSPEERRPWTCLVDEWPSFAAAQPETIENVLSQTRKFNLRLYLAAQSLAQVGSGRLSGALENCRLQVTFRLGTDSAKIQAEHIASIDPYRVKRPPRTLTGPPQYMSASEQMREWQHTLANLPARQAYAKLHDQPSVRIATLTVGKPELARGALDVIIAEYRRRYQVPKAEGFLPVSAIVPGAGFPAGVGAAQAAPTPESAFGILQSSHNIYETSNSAQLDLSALFGEDIDDD